MVLKKISGQRLRELRQARNLSLQDVADALGTLKGTISNIERGTKPASLEMLINLANYFNVSLDYLTGRSDDPSPPQVQPVKCAKKLYDVIARAKDLPDELIEDITDTLDALIELHLKKLKTKEKDRAKGE